MTRAEQVIWALAVLGLAAAALASQLTPALFPHAWLSALVLFSTWPLGSIGLLLIHQLTGGRWGDVITPALRLGAATTPLLVPLILPVLLTLPSLYPWAAHHVANAWYLNPQFFALRGVVYLVVWCALAACVLLGRAGAVAAPGLILLGVTLNFAAIDLTMSLDPEFNSTVYGMLAATGAALLALAVAIALSAPAVAAKTLGDLGKLLLALVILWIYLDFMQLLIVWQSDLVSEVPWYEARMHGPWGIVLLLVVLFHFLLPFAILLFPRLQRRVRAVTAVAVLLVATEILRTWWTVLPAVPRFITWVDVACMLGVASLAAGIACRVRARTQDGAQPVGAQPAKVQHV